MKKSWTESIIPGRIAITVLAALTAPVIELINSTIAMRVIPRFYLFLYWLLRGDPRGVFSGIPPEVFPYYDVVPTLLDLFMTEISAMLYFYIPIAFIFSLPVAWIAKYFAVHREYLVTIAIAILLTTCIATWVTSTGDQYQIVHIVFLVHLGSKLSGFIMGIFLAYILSERKVNARHLVLLPFYLGSLLVHAISFLAHATMRPDESLDVLTIGVMPAWLLCLAILAISRTEYNKNELAISGLETGFLLAMSGVLTIITREMLVLLGPDVDIPRQWFITNLITVFFLVLIVSRLVMEPHKQRLAGIFSRIKPLIMKLS